MRTQPPTSSLPSPPTSSSPTLTVRRTPATSTWASWLAATRTFTTRPGIARHTLDGLLSEVQRGLSACRGRRGGARPAAARRNRPVGASAARLGQRPSGPAGFTRCEETVAVVNWSAHAWAPPRGAHPRCRLKRKEQADRDVRSADPRTRRSGRGHRRRAALAGGLCGGAPRAGVPELRVRAHGRPGGLLLPARRPPDPHGRAGLHGPRADHPGPHAAPPGGRLRRAAAGGIRADQLGALLRRAVPGAVGRGLSPRAPADGPRVGHRARARRAGA